MTGHLRPAAQVRLKSNQSLVVTIAHSVRPVKLPQVRSFLVTEKISPSGNVLSSKKDYVSDLTIEEVAMSSGKTMAREVGH